MVLKLGRPQHITDCDAFVWRFLLETNNMLNESYMSINVLQILWAYNCVNSLRTNQLSTLSPTKNRNQNDCWPDQNGQFSLGLIKVSNVLSTLSLLSNNYQCLWYRLSNRDKGAKKSERQIEVNDFYAVSKRQMGSNLANKPSAKQND